MTGRSFDGTGHAYVLATLLLTVYGQLVLKWQMLGVGQLPALFLDKLLFLLRLVANPWVLSGFVAAFLASLCWMAAMTRLEMSYAYPFMSLSFVLVVAAGAIFYGEPLTLAKLAGVLMVIAGLVVIARG